MRRTAPLALLFALLGPVVALGGLLDSRLHTRRARRASGERALYVVLRTAQQEIGQFNHLVTIDGVRFERP